MPASGTSAASLLEQWYDDIEDGRAFVRGVSFTSGAGVAPHIQLNNPVGSGVTIQVRRVQYACSPAALIGFINSSTVYPTLVGVGFNMRDMVTSGLGELRTGAFVYPQGIEVARLEQSVNAGYTWADEWNLRLSEGAKVAFASGTNASRIEVTFTWSEYAL